MKELSSKTEKKLQYEHMKNMKIFHSLPKIENSHYLREKSRICLLHLDISFIKLTFPISLWTCRDTGSSGKAADLKLYHWHLSLQTNNLVSSWKSHYFCNQIYVGAFHHSWDCSLSFGVANVMHLIQRCPHVFSFPSHKKTPPNQWQKS